MSKPQPTKVTTIEDVLHNLLEYAEPYAHLDEAEAQLEQLLIEARIDLPEATPRNAKTLVAGWIMSHENQIGWNLAVKRVRWLNLNNKAKGE